MTRPLTAEQFIAASRAKYGPDRYDYSLVHYVSYGVNVTLRCNTCTHLFQQSPGNHLHNCTIGCPKCAHAVQVAKRKCSFEDFISKAIAVHGDLYEYKNAVYVNGKTEIEILCKRCNVTFQQAPLLHVNRGHGCRACNTKAFSETRFDNFESFVAKANKTHGNKYSYDKVVYVRSNERVEIECVRHGVFHQRPNDHVRGQGCPSCISHVSRISILWLEIRDNTHIQHGRNDSEYRIPGTSFRADGYSGDLHKVYEFLGDYYHGNPSKYPSTTCNTQVHQTMGELHKRTMERNQKIVDAGYTLEYIWQADFMHMIESAKVIQKHWRKWRKT